MLPEAKHKSEAKPVMQEVIELDVIETIHESILNSKQNDINLSFQFTSHVAAESK